MALTEDEVIRILNLVEQSSFGELRLETADLKLLVRKKGYGGANSGPDVRFGNSGTPPNTTPQPVIEQAPTPGESARTKGLVITCPEGMVTIKSPMLGTVYLRPSPDAPNYVEVGSHVKKDDTVCLIEVMKVFTAVKAEVNGLIADILVDTNEMVEYGQQLFLVKPDTEPSGKD
jgi:acetyl-CoA carboxylase biotin carboxyl carrier protein